MPDGRPPTQHAEVNEALQHLLEGARMVLADHFVGLYLHGSLASGDFDPHRSDVDFLVVTAGPLPKTFLPALEAMHGRMTTSGLRWTSKLEGAYIPHSALRRYDPAQAVHPWLGADGHFAVERLGWDWVIQRHILREHGLALAGPPVRPLIDPVGPEALRHAVRELLREWWAPQLGDPSGLLTADYQVYAILTMCRALHTLRFGEVVTKPVAARWAREALGKPWAVLIDLALAWRPPALFDRLEETLGLIRRTLWQAEGEGFTRRPA